MLDIGKEISSRISKKTNESLENVSEIIEAYKKDQLEPSGREKLIPQFLTKTLLDMFLYSVFVLMALMLCLLFVKDVFVPFMILMAMVIVFAEKKDFFGITDLLLAAIVKFRLKRNKYAYYELLYSRYFYEPVDSDIYEECLKQYSMEEMMSISDRGVVSNFNVIKLANSKMAQESNVEPQAE